MAKGTQLVNAVITALEQISTGNGYHTTAGADVRRGRPEHLTIEQHHLPLITVSSITAGSASIKPRSNRKDREIQVVGLVDAAQDDYEPDLDRLDEDLTRALAQLTDIDALPGTMQIQISGGDYTHPEGGSNTAAVSYTVTISYALTFNHEG